MHGPHLISQLWSRAQPTRYQAAAVRGPAWLLVSEPSVPQPRAAVHERCPDAASLGSRGPSEGWGTPAPPCSQPSCVPSSAWAWMCCSSSSSATAWRALPGPLSLPRCRPVCAISSHADVCIHGILCIHDVFMVYSGLGYRLLAISRCMAALDGWTAFNHRCGHTQAA